MDDQSLPNSPADKNGHDEAVSTPIDVIIADHHRKIRWIGPQNVLTLAAVILSTISLYFSCQGHIYQRRDRANALATTVEIYLTDQPMTFELRAKNQNATINDVWVYFPPQVGSLELTQVLSPPDWKFNLQECGAKLQAKLDTSTQQIITAFKVKVNWPVRLSWTGLQLPLAISVRYIVGQEVVESRWHYSLYYSYFFRIDSSRGNSEIQMHAIVPEKSIEGGVIPIEYLRDLCSHEFPMSKGQRFSVSTGIAATMYDDESAAVSSSVKLREINSDSASSTE